MVLTCIMPDGGRAGMRSLVAALPHRTWRAAVERAVGGQGKDGGKGRGCRQRKGQQRKGQR